MLNNSIFSQDINITSQRISIRRGSDGGCMRFRATAVEAIGGNQ